MLSGVFVGFVCLKALERREVLPDAFCLADPLFLNRVERVDFLILATTGALLSSLDGASLLFSSLSFSIDGGEASSGSSDAGFYNENGWMIVIRNYEMFYKSPVVNSPKSRFCCPRSIHCRFLRSQSSSAIILTLLCCTARTWGSSLSVKLNVC